MIRILPFLLLFVLLNSGCQHLRKNVGSKRFTIEKQWVASTLSEEYLGFRHTHRMTPIVTEQLVIQGNAIDGISAYNRKTGHMVWKLKLKNGVEGGAQLVDRTLYFGAGDGFFYSVDIDQGLINWTTPIRSEGLGTPLVKNNVVYFLSGNNILYAIDAKSGKMKWQYNRRNPSMVSIRGGSQPVLVGNQLYVGFSDGYLVAIHKAKGSVIWEKSLNPNSRFKDIDGTPVIEGDRLYISSFDNRLYCLDRKKGRIIWVVDEGGYTTVTLSKKRIFYSTSTGHVVALDKQSGKRIWRIKLDKGQGTQPVLYRGLLVFGVSGGDLKVVSASSGEEVSHYAPGRGVMSSPFVDKTTGQVYFISANANLFVLKMGWKSPAETLPWEKN